jgi:hypothetical protein
VKGLYGNAGRRIVVVLPAFQDKRGESASLPIAATRRWGGCIFFFCGPFSRAQCSAVSTVFVEPQGMVSEAAQYKGPTGYYISARSSHTRHTIPTLQRQRACALDSTVGERYRAIIATRHIIPSQSRSPIPCTINLETPPTPL